MKDMNEEETEYRQLIEEIKGLPGHSPRMSYRMKIVFLTRWHGLVHYLRVKPWTASVDRPYDRAWAGIAIATMVLVVLVASFFGTARIANGSAPGDALYWLDKLHEKLTLALTRDPVRKASVWMDLAEERLGEMKKLEEDGRLERDDFQALSKEVEEDIEASRGLIAEEGVKLQDRETLLTRLNGVTVYKENVLAGIASSSQITGEENPAAGVTVTIKDTADNSLLNGQKGDLRLTADQDGEVSFTQESLNRKGAVQVEATIEGQEKRTVSPLETRSEKKTGEGRYTVEVSPALEHIPCLQEQEFTIELTDSKRNKPAGRRKIILEDRSGTGLLDNDPAPLEGETDEDGRFDFKFIKTSADKVSRIALTACGAYDEDLGDIITLGATQQLSEAEGAYILSESPVEGDAGLLLENRGARVRLSRDGRDVISALGTDYEGEIAGPIRLDIEKVKSLTGLDYGPPKSMDVEVGQDGSLALASSFDFNGEKDGLCVSYEVALCRDDPLVLVDVVWENRSRNPTEFDSSHVDLPLLSITVPGAGRIDVGGQSLTGDRAEQNYQVDTNKPFALIYRDGAAISVGQTDPSFTDLSVWGIEREGGCLRLDVEAKTAELKPGKRYHWTLFVGLSEDADAERALAQAEKLFPAMLKGLEPKTLVGPEDRGYRMRLYPESMLDYHGRFTLKVLEPLP